MREEHLDGLMTALSIADNFASIVGIVATGKCAAQWINIDHRVPADQPLQVDAASVLAMQEALASSEDVVFLPVNIELPENTHHVNMLVVDRRAGRVWHFEPLGNRGNQRKHRYRDIRASLATALGLPVTPFARNCQQNDDYCMLWCLLFAQHYTPDISAPQLRNRLSYAGIRPLWQVLDDNLKPIYRGFSFNHMRTPSTRIK